ncbi:hypothetical protein [Streptomyces sp. 1331.2]|uniref:hypothetical protein n=1 Tax=Streptomyces sp. 1331.2 TaxID=1938835 RepID=UPI000BD0AE55|nr:hypothetical protein [Streptomyces sp. 1331.2]SOB85882.1 hypothetical protein SAMN06272789_6183 [Streptomyces sp. 1331.2]
MPRVHRPSRRSTASHPAAAGLLCAVLALTAGCSAADPGPAAPSAPSAVSAPPPAAAPAAVAYGLPPDLTPVLLPASGPDTRLTQGLDGFTSLVRERATRACLDAARVRVPDAPPPMFIRQFEIPDLAHIARHGFSASTVPDTTAPAPAATSADPAVQRRCDQEGAKAAGDLQSGYGPLQSRWFSGLAAVEQDAAVLAARRGLPDCLSAQGVRADSEQHFFDQVDRTLQGAATDQAASAEDRRLGAAYATCMQPVEAAREPLRAALRDSFVREHAAELAQVRDALPGRIAELERRYSIRFAAPTED